VISIQYSVLERMSILVPFPLFKQTSCYRCGAGRWRDSSQEIKFNNLYLIYCNSDKDPGNIYTPSTNENRPRMRENTGFT